MEKAGISWHQKTTRLSKIHTSCALFKDNETAYESELIYSIALFLFTVSTAITSKRGLAKVRNPSHVLDQADSQKEDKKFTWPRELLPQDVDSARIFTWGYDSKVAKLHGYPSQEGIFGHSENLLSDLVRLRSEAQAVSRVIDVPVILRCFFLTSKTPLMNEH